MFDTGYGEVFNVIRLVNEIEAAGAAAIQEDQELPKKCGHLNGKKLISKKEMVTKVKAASKTNLKIIARTDFNLKEYSLQLIELKNMLKLGRI